MKYKNTTHFKIFLPTGEIFLPKEEKELSDTVATVLGVVIVPAAAKKVITKKAVIVEEESTDGKQTR